MPATQLAERTTHAAEPQAAERESVETLVAERQLADRESAERQPLDRMPQQAEPARPVLLSPAPQAPAEPARVFAEPDLPGPVEEFFLTIGWLTVERIVAVILFFKTGRFH